MTGLDDPALDDFAARTERTDDIRAALTPLIAARPYAHWAQVFEAEDVPFAPVNGLEDLARDPHLRARGVVRMVGAAQVMAFPVPMAGMGDPAGHVPAVGEHQAEILDQAEETE
jgi:crotonobetainyl-CoA:carnitine CoA-transferase CaiB-like acyl-CoA transferase